MNYWEKQPGEPILNILRYFRCFFPCKKSWGHAVTKLGPSWLQWSQNGESTNCMSLIIVTIFVLDALAGKGAAVGITKGCSSEMLCWHSLCCDANRIHVMGKGSAQLGSAGIRDAHAPPTGSFTYLCHSGVPKDIQLLEGEKNADEMHSTITHSVLLGWFCSLDAFP